MPRPSHLIILALAAALYIYALSSDKSLLALPTKPIPGPTLIVWLHSAAPYLIILTYWLGQWAIASSVGHRSIDKVLTQSGARSAGSC
ncbi:MULTISPECIES: hypothetical protein [Pseudomonas]|uniref:Uncharacterized protein n=1 Tax=Pseudomonas monteilii TaxID=76759 RepID=A0AAP7FRR0_9PSED|nr:MULTISPECIES: hypothetical protein [Pseudomonas]KPM62555.1 hypothetical protein HB4184_15470 [Pseudomonas putida]MCE0874980.1 hypothetical protein [Pseudomonas monteilii]MCE0925157.1 hypothetical protein [Pseudomonas monteilii]MCE0930894.1 hypothetical protein [Pseudomonas monteilii]MCE0977182.1 hypothetical protein [Pseudomonas monteilii]